MKVAIMQPYFMPYIGYFQLMDAVDTFVVYDGIQFTKKGWINRNRILVNGSDQFITLPLKKDSDFLNVNERYLSDDFTSEKKKIINKIKGTYVKAPFYTEVCPIIEQIFAFENTNLFDFIFNSLVTIKKYLSIETIIIKSSQLALDITLLKGQDKVIQICQFLEAKTYINPIGGLALYNSEDFAKAGISLYFLQALPFDYSQFKNDFIPWLSIIDVLMFNSVTEVKAFLPNYKLI